MDMPVAIAEQSTVATSKLPGQGMMTGVLLLNTVTQVVLSLVTLTQTVTSPTAIDPNTSIRTAKDPIAISPIAINPAVISQVEAILTNATSERSLDDTAHYYGALLTP